jgi:octaprenyl-diphosphate synthase
MLGDILYSKGFFELNHISVEVSKLISNAVVQLSLGELKDVSLSQNFNVDKDQYLEMIYQKTASLIEASAGAAAVLAGKPKAPFMIYGRNLGLAFQMIDDLLDITQDSQTLGKPALHDFVEGKTTLPYIYLYEVLDEEGKAKLRGMHARVLKAEELNWLKVQFEERQILMKCYAQARELIDEAVELMNQLGENALSEIAMEMIDREF